MDSEPVSEKEDIDSMPLIERQRKCLIKLTDSRAIILPWRWLQHAGYKDWDVVVMSYKDKRIIIEFIDQNDVGVYTRRGGKE